MTSLARIPEVSGLDGGVGTVRIPPQIDVPLTPRVRRLIDTPQFRRLARISQLGLVSLIYPAAIHTRFEHSLGVYRLALLFLRRLSHDARFERAVGTEQAELFIVSALLHDLGHWPFCHPLEDIRLDGVPAHERFAARFLQEDEIAIALRRDWNLEPGQVLDLLNHQCADPGGRVLDSMLSGPIDIDKMDYLFRDSLHAGVPYGQNFDQNRLIASLCLNEAGDGLAITEKGKTAAEMMVFARYVMFSEVYWHHGVRAATAMLQRAFSLIHDRLNLEEAFGSSESSLINRLGEAARGTAAAELLDGLFGHERRLYKRVAQYSFLEQRGIYTLLARRPFTWLTKCAEQLAETATRLLGQPIAGHEILLDAPPVEREVEFRVDVNYPKEGKYRPLGEVSPVVRTLAKEQFDDFVKRVRVFAHPRVAAVLRERRDLPQVLMATVEQLGDG
jgi:HD superfamily phosphohydrolase